MANIVVIGAGLGGLPAAYELRHYLGNEHQVTLISDHEQFTFIPGLIRVALDLHPLDHVQLDLKELSERHHLNLILSKVTQLNPETQTIILENQQSVQYDYVAIATGASLAWDLIPGLGTYTESVCTPHHAIEAREKWLKFLENPGHLVVGAAPGAGCFGPAYEFILMADYELRRRGLRDKATLTYVTPEPYAGHLGVSKVKNAEKLTVGLLKEKGIRIIDNVEILKVDPDHIHLSTGEALPFDYSMILPAFRGVEFVQEAVNVGNEKGFIPILPTCCHTHYPNIYGIGVSVHLEQPDKTPIPIGLPKSGQMTEAMAMAVSHNIAVELGAINAPLQVPTLEALCFAEFGDTGIAYIAVPIIPDPSTGKRRYSYAVKGQWIVWLKELFEAYFMRKMRWGMGVPWFEQLGLKVLFGLSLLKPLVKLPEIPTNSTYQELNP